MGTFTAADLERLVEGGCPSCGGHTAEFQAYVEQSRPIQGGEPVGKATWAYDGEAFVEGVFEASCVDCDHTHFTSSACPRCGAEDGLARALESENAFPMPEACPRCGVTDLSFRALVPAETTSEGKRSSKAKTDVAPEDPGFHGLRADCKSCGTIAKVERGCPLCAAG